MSFEQFFAIYPRRVNRALAEKKYNQALKETDHETLINGASEYAQWCERNGVANQYIVGKSLFLNQSTQSL